MEAAVLFVLLIVAGGDDGAIHYRHASVDPRPGGIHDGVYLVNEPTDD